MKKSLLLFLFLTFPLVGNADFENWYEESKPEEIPLIGQVEMAGEVIEEEIVRLTIKMSDFNKSVLGVSFNLIYDPDSVRFLSYLPGNFLEQGGDPIYMVSDQSEGGKIIFGSTLKGEDSFPLGSGDLANLQFEILNGEQFDFAFEDGVVSNKDVIVQDLEKVNWVDGVVDSMTIQPAESSLNEAKNDRNFWELLGVFLMGVFFVLTLFAAGSFIKNRNVIDKNLPI